MSSTKICTIGGGTGQATILKALTSLPNTQLTGIVATTDNGGSSAVVRESLNMPSPGDVRNCLNHLSDKDSLFSQLFSYRFQEGELTGTHLGNLLLGAATQLTGSFQEAVDKIHGLLGIQARILPVSDISTQICAELTTGQHISGEWQIIKRRNNAPIKRYYLEDPIMATPSVLSALHDADCLIICPGVLGTAIISTLLHQGIQEAIQKSKAQVVYFCNVMTYPSQTDGFAVSDHVYLLEEYLGRNIDVVYANTMPPPKTLLEHYKTYGSELVNIDTENLIHHTLVCDEFLIDYKKTEGALELDRAAGKGQHVGMHYIRHDGEKVASHIKDLLGLST